MLFEGQAVYTPRVLISIQQFHDHIFRPYNLVIQLYCVSFLRNTVSQEQLYKVILVWKIKGVPLKLCTN